MDWENRWFLCRICNCYIRTPKSFLSHKDINCGNLNSVTTSKATPARKPVDSTIGVCRPIKAKAKQFKCKSCSYSSCYAGDLKKHSRGHVGETPFKCDLCSASFNTQRFLIIHVAKQHKDPNRSKSKSCRFCSKVFTCVSERESHERVHTGERPFECNKCSADFKRKSTLNHHMLVHEETKRLKCNLCNFVSNYQKDLLIHFPIHTGEKPYACKMCTYTCNQLGSLKAHSRTHTGEKPFKCDTCDFAFARGSHLKQHSLRIHTEEKPFKCSSCKYATASSRALKQHLKNHGEKAFKCQHCD